MRQPTALLGHIAARPLHGHTHGARTPQHAASSVAPHSGHPRLDGIVFTCHGTGKTTGLNFLLKLDALGGYGRTVCMLNRNIRMRTPHDIAFSREGPAVTKIRALKKFWILLPRQARSSCKATALYSPDMQQYTVCGVCPTAHRPIGSMPSTFTANVMFQLLIYTYAGRSVTISDHQIP